MTFSGLGKSLSVEEGKHSSSGSGSLFLMWIDLNVKGISDSCSLYPRHL